MRAHSTPLRLLNFTRRQELNNSILQSQDAFHQNTDISETSCSVSVLTSTDLTSSSSSNPSSVISLSSKGFSQSNTYGFDNIKTLLSLDVADNSLSFPSFQDLPNLLSLSLRCNEIKSITDNPDSVTNESSDQPIYPGNFINSSSIPYQSLRVLDLSFNSLTIDCLQQLQQLPHLEILDLSHNFIGGSSTSSSSILSTSSSPSSSHFPSLHISLHTHTSVLLAMLI